MTSADQGAVPPSAGPSLSRRERFTRWLGKASFWKTLGAVATSVVAISTAIVAIATFRVSSQTLQANTLQQASDRFDKAIEHLGSGSRDVRLGGIYALEKLARDTPSEHSQVYDVLTSYVRGHAVVGKDMCADSGPPGVVPSSPAPTSPAPSPLAAPPSPAPSSLGSIGPRPDEDIQTVIYLVGRRDRKYDAVNESVDFLHTCLRGASFLAETVADYSDASMNSADLRSANFGLAKLENVFMYGVTLDDALMTSAKLRGAHLSFART